MRQRLLDRGCDLHIEIVVEEPAWHAEPQRRGLSARCLRVAGRLSADAHRIEWTFTRNRVEHGRTVERSAAQRTNVVERLGDWKNPADAHRGVDSHREDSGAPGANRSAVAPDRVSARGAGTAGVSWPPH